MACCVLLCFVMLCCYVMSCYAMLCYIMYVMSCYVMSCHVMLCCYVMSCHVMLHNVMLGQVRFCYARLRYIWRNRKLSSSSTTDFRCHDKTMSHTLSKNTKISCYLQVDLNSLLYEEWRQLNWLRNAGSMKNGDTFPTVIHLDHSGWINTPEMKQLLRTPP